MKIVLITLFLLLSACVSQKEAHDRGEASARQYCYNVARAMYGFPGLADNANAEYKDCLRSLGY